LFNGPAGFAGCGKVKIEAFSDKDLFTFKALILFFSFDGF